MGDDRLPEQDVRWARVSAFSKESPATGVPLRPGDRGPSRQAAPARDELLIEPGRRLIGVARRLIKSGAREAGSAQSMGSVGRCFDNAMAESFFAGVETELLDRTSFRIRAEARLAVFDYIEAFDNPRGRHSALGYLSPAEFELESTR